MLDSSTNTCLLHPHPTKKNLNELECRLCTLSMIKTQTGQRPYDYLDEGLHEIRIMFTFDPKSPAQRIGCYTPWEQYQFTHWSSHLLISLTWTYLFFLAILYLYTFSELLRTLKKQFITIHLHWKICLKWTFK